MWLKKQNNPRRQGESMFAPTHPPSAALHEKARSVLLLCVICALCACQSAPFTPAADPNREYSQGAPMQSPPPVAEQRMGESARFRAQAAPQTRPASAQNDSGYITLQPGETLTYISALYGVSEKDLMAWNGLHSAKDIHAGRRLAIRSPQMSSAPSVQTPVTAQTPPAAQTPLPPRDDPASGGVIVVAPGQSLSGIARQYGVTTAQLREWNGLDSDKIRAGRTLRVQPPVARSSDALGAPASQGRAAQRPKQEPAPVAASRTPAAKKGAEQPPKQEAARSVAPKTPAKPDAPDASGMITVQSGQNLSGIAAKYKVSTADLRQWNKLKGDQVKIGQKLRVTAPVRVHTVREGESLNGIAAKYKVSAGAIMQKNRLANADRLPVGKELIIP
jgi:LysM repeat protein